MDSDNILEEIGCYLEIMLAFNSQRDKLLWQYIITSAAQLEYLSIAVLLVHERVNPADFWEYEERTTLNQAAGKLEKLFSQDTINRLKSVAKMRNSIVHRGLIRGVTEHTVYNGKQIFSDNETLM